MAASPVHPASLVDPALHSPALMELIEISLGRSLIEHIVDTVVETVDYALGRPSSSSRGRSLSRNTEHAKFLKFVTDVINKAEVKVPALLVTLVYIDRAKPHIQIALEQWANERVFLGALIVANKYLNDSTLKNVHWALCTGVFGKRDIGRIEREFLDVLDFELSVSEADLLAHHDALLALSHAPRLPARAAHQHHARRRSSPLGSHWSADSSEMDVDSESSFESVSLPRTPEPHAPVSAVPFPPPRSSTWTLRRRRTRTYTTTRTTPTPTIRIRIRSIGHAPLRCPSSALSLCPTSTHTRTRIRIRTRGRTCPPRHRITSRPSRSRSTSRLLLRTRCPCAHEHRGPAFLALLYKIPWPRPRA
ncbi:hypothetical protein C8Q78DRAFT_671394 [Trametes maxima]|nr:hypothetical protein C8Q78DRAFT_671394 [Trametes maxima]